MTKKDKAHQGFKTKTMPENWRGNDEQTDVEAFYFCDGFIHPIPKRQVEDPPLVPGAMGSDWLDCRDVTRV